MESEHEPYQDEPALVCPRLLACLNIRYDAADVDAGYSLERVLVHIRPADGGGYPFAAPRMFLFTQFHGTPGEYTVRVRMFSVVVEDGVELPAEETFEFGPWDIELPGDNYVECYGFRIAELPFLHPGIYEFQLWIDGQDEMMANERIEARE